jgi:hypothetical protein
MAHGVARSRGTGQLLARAVSVYGERGGLFYR